MTTLSDYRSIASNLSRWQTLTAKTPAVATASAYYSANIGKVTSIDAFIGNRRLFGFAMSAFGLDDMVNAKALMRKVLEGGVTDTKALANTLDNPKILAFAKAFDFAAQGASVMSSAAATTGVVASYIEQSLETTQGTANKGVQLALYFARKAPAITNVYEILADKNLLNVVQTVLGISPLTSAQNVDTQAATLKKALTLADFSDTKKLGAFVARFAARYDVDNATSAASASAAGGIGLSADSLLSLQSFRGTF